MHNFMQLAPIVPVRNIYRFVCTMTNSVQISPENGGSACFFFCSLL